jgi:hypothetical protein
MKHWDGGGIPDALWDLCCEKYSQFENGMVAKFNDLVSDKNTAIWICPALLSKHLNINDVHLLVVNVEKNTKKKLSFDWLRGWKESEVEESEV